MTNLNFLIEIYLLLIKLLNKKVVMRKLRTIPNIYGDISKILLNNESKSNYLFPFLLFI